MPSLALSRSSGLLAALLCLFSFVFAAHLSANEQEDSDGVRKMEGLIMQKRKELSVLKGSLDIYLQMASHNIRNFARTLEEDKVRYHQTSYLLKVNEANPFEFKLVCFEFFRQEKSFRAALSKLEFIFTDCESYLAISRQASDELSALRAMDKSQADYNKDLDQSIALLMSFEKRLADLRVQLLAVLEPGRAQLALRQTGLDGMKTLIENNLRENLLRSSGSMLDEDFWLLMPHSFKRWYARGVFSVQNKLPSSPRVWLRALSASAVALLLLLFLRTRFLTAGRLASCERLRPGSGKLISVGVVFLIAGLCLMAGAYAIRLPDNIFIFFLGSFCCSAALLEIGWGLKILFTETLRQRSPLYPLFYAYVLGIMLEVFDVPPMGLSMIWTPCMAILAFVCWRILQDKGNGLLFPQKVNMALSLGIALLSAAASFLGFATFSLVAITSWFMLAVSFHFASACSGALKSLIGSKPELGYAARSAALGFAIPAIWLLFLLMAICGISWQLVDLQTCLDVAMGSFSIGDFHFRPLAALFAVFLFFVVKTSLNVLLSAVESNSSKGGLDASVATPFKILVSCSLWAVYALVAIRIFGVDLSHLGVILGGLSVGLGFGMQNFVSNLVSGLMLLFGREIREGDIIQIGDTWAKIERISLRSTLACTNDNAIISIPNSNLLSNQVTNWTLNNRHIRRDIKLPGIPSNRVEDVRQALLVSAAESHQVMKMPAPEVLVGAVSSSSVDLSLRIWILDIEKADSTLSELNSKIERRLQLPVQPKDVPVPVAAVTVS